MSFLGGITGNLAGGNIGHAVVQLVLDQTGYNASLEKTKAETAASTSSMSSAFSKFGGAAALAVGAVATGAIVKFAASSVAAFEESNQILQQTQAVLKSTGGAAGVTADQVQALGTALEQTTTFSDEQVRSTENLLLTFTKIGSDVFPQTTQVVLDMSAALGQDLKNSAIQVGKALQDPTVGLTALRRVGVSFTADQSDLITKLYETGRAAQAQKLILAELTKEFGGSAAAAANTFSGRMAQVRNQFDNMQEEVGKALIPALEDIIPAIEAIIPLVGDLARALPIDAIQATADGLAGIANILPDNTEETAQNTAALNAFEAAWGALNDTLGVYSNGALASADAQEQAQARARLYNEALGLVDETTGKAIYTQQQAIDTFLTLPDATGAASDAIGQFATSSTQSITSFAGMTGKELKTWETDTVTSITDAFNTLGTKTKDIFDTTGKELNHEFAAMLAQAVRFQGDLSKLTKLKPGSFGIPKSDVQAFEAFLTTQAPGKLDAFVNLSHAAQERDIQEWVRHQRIVEGFGRSIDSLPETKTIHINVDVPLDAQRFIDSLNRQF